MTKLSVKIRVARMKLKISCAEVDRRAGLSVGMTAKLEAGVDVDPRVSTVAKLALALGVSVRSLLQ